MEKQMMKLLRMVATIFPLGLVFILLMQAETGQAEGLGQKPIELRELETVIHNHAGVSHTLKARIAVDVESDESPPPDAWLHAVRAEIVRVLAGYKLHGFQGSSAIESINIEMTKAARSLNSKIKVKEVFFRSFAISRLDPHRQG